MKFFRQFEREGNYNLAILARLTGKPLTETWTKNKELDFGEILNSCERIGHPMLYTAHTLNDFYW